ncbi:MAG: ATP synthase F1 subunit delta [Sporomusaceae bacterium]|nr:ATP synthase F1 subunit delta [Sporomusaceae bacterium]
MLNNQLASKYAQALCLLAQEKGVLAEAGRQLALVVETAASNPDFGGLLYHPLIPTAAKKETIEKVFDGELMVIVKNFLFVVIDKRRETALPAILQAYTDFANESQNILPAEVTTAAPLTGAQEAALAEKLGVMTGKTVVITQRIDARLLGGVVVKIGDKLIDGSVARQLKTLQAALLRTPLTKIGVTG